MKVLALLAVVSQYFGLSRFRHSFTKNDEAALEFEGALKVVGVVLGVIITFIVIAQLFGPFTDAVRDINENLSNADFGEDTTNSLAPVFAIVVGLGSLIGLVVLLLSAYRRME